MIKKYFVFGFVHACMCEASCVWECGCAQMCSGRSVEVRGQLQLLLRGCHPPCFLFIFFFKDRLIFKSRLGLPGQ